MVSDWLRLSPVADACSVAVPIAGWELDLDLEHARQEAGTDLMKPRLTRQQRIHNEAKQTKRRRHKRADTGQQAAAPRPRRESCPTIIPHSAGAQWVPTVSSAQTHLAADVDLLLPHEKVKVCTLRVNAQQTPCTTSCRSCLTVRAPPMQIPNDQLTYRLQGDQHLNTPKSVTRRVALKHSIHVIRAIRTFWNTFESVNSVFGRITEPECVFFFVLCTKTLYPVDEWVLEDAQAVALEEWARAKATAEDPGKFMSFSDFFQQLYELVDIWCPSIAEEDYVDFLDKLFRRISKEVMDQQRGRLIEFRTVDEVLAGGTLADINSTGPVYCSDCGCEVPCSDGNGDGRPTGTDVLCGACQAKGLAGRSSLGPLDSEAPQDNSEPPPDNPRPNYLTNPDGSRRRMRAALRPLMCGMLMDAEVEDSRCNYSDYYKMRYGVSKLQRRVRARLKTKGAAAKKIQFRIRRKALERQATALRNSKAASTILRALRSCALLRRVRARTARQRAADIDKDLQQILTADTDNDIADHFAPADDSRGLRGQPTEYDRLEHLTGAVDRSVSESTTTEANRSQESARAAAAAAEVALAAAHAAGFAAAAAGEVCSAGLLERRSGAPHERHAPHQEPAPELLAVVAAVTRGVVLTKVQRKALVTCVGAMKARLRSRRQTRRMGLEAPRGSQPDLQQASRHLLHNYCGDYCGDADADDQTAWRGAGAAEADGRVRR